MPSARVRISAAARDGRLNRDASNRTVHQAVDGAATKLTKLIDHTLGRRRELESRRTDPASEELALPES